MYPWTTSRWKGGEEKMNVKRRTLSHSKSLGRRKTFVGEPIDKELLGEEAAIDKSERNTFEQASMVKEQ